MDRIDAHHHFWHPARGDYGWMPDDDPVLSRPYGPADLAPDLAAAGVKRTVLVQAAPSLEETEYMLGLADATEHVAAVIGWIDFEDPRRRRHLRRLSRHPRFRGVRPMIQDLPDDHWMHGREVQWAFRAVAEAGLVFEALGFPRHVLPFLELCRRYPDLRIVLDHGLKPQIGVADAFGPWAEGMSMLAGETNAFCKISGLVTEAGPDWSVQALKPYVDHLLGAFGPERLMWGSDWPVCRLRTEYGGWVAATETLLAHLPEAARARIWAGTAAEVYRI